MDPINDPSVPWPADGDHPQKELVVSITAVWTVLGVLFVFLRMLCRIFVMKKTGWDDYTIVGAALGTIIGAGLDFPEASYGFGRHKKFLNAHQWREYLKYGYGEWIQTFTTLTLTKVSICLFVLRIAVTPTFIRPIQAFTAILIVSNLILTLLWIFQCKPIATAWDQRSDGKCFNKEQLEHIILSQAVISAVSDFVLAAFPVVILHSLHVSWKKKAAILSLMGLGIITGVCCIVRTTLNWQTQATDLTWQGLTNWVWRSVEVNIGMVAACIPAMIPGWRAIRNKIKRRDSEGPYDYLECSPRLDDPTAAQQQEMKRRRPSRRHHPQGFFGNSTWASQPTFNFDPATTICAEPRPPSRALRKGRVSPFRSFNDSGDDIFEYPMSPTPTAVVNGNEIRKTTTVAITNSRAPSPPFYNPEKLQPVHPPPSAQALDEMKFESGPSWLSDDTASISGSARKSTKGRSSDSISLNV